MVFCTCLKAEIVNEVGMEPHCSKCGLWWDERYGSTKPETFLETLRQRRESKKSPFKTGRNDPCHCGSGKKYKKCCLYPYT